MEQARQCGLANAHQGVEVCVCVCVCARRTWKGGECVPTYTPQ